MSETTPLSESISIVFCGLRNSGKSSLLNNLFQKEIAIVSDLAGTTTDPVTRKMELADFGPVSVTDTAGIDDVGEVGNKRIGKSMERIKAADINVLVSNISKAPTYEEISLAREIQDANKSMVVALTHQDKNRNQKKIEWAKDFGYTEIDNISKKGFEELKKRLLSLKDLLTPEITPLEGLVNEGDLLLLVAPIDLAAPKGRLIMPQTQTIRDALDKDCAALIVKERELYQFYSSLPQKPKLVITDSQVFSKCSADIPPEQPLTSFSILFARKKGDLKLFLSGVKQLDNIKSGDKIIVLESCAHHKHPDDIGTVKIPRLFRQLVNPDVEFEFLKSLPADEKLKEYKLIIHCAGCMMKRNQMILRLNQIKDSGIAVTNYGIFLAWANGLLPRAIEMFPDVMADYLSSN